MSEHDGIVSGQAFLDALCKTLGIESHFVTRVVLDARKNARPRVFIQRAGTCSDVQRLSGLLGRFREGGVVGGTISVDDDGEIGVERE